jgi:hypothetical protein
MKHIRILSILLIALNIQCNSNIDNRIAEEQIENLNSTTKVEYIPKRINKCIELFEDGQPRVEFFIFQKFQMILMFKKIKYNFIKIKFMSLIMLKGLFLNS